MKKSRVYRVGVTFIDGHFENHDLLAIDKKLVYGWLGTLKNVHSTTITSTKMTNEMSNDFIAIELFG